MRTLALAALIPVLLGGCATGPMRGPVDVMRYHLDTVATGTSQVQPASAADEMGFGFRAYADAVAGELTRVGYPAAAAGTTAQYLAVVAVRRVPRGTVERPSPFSIGVGGGSFSGGRRGGVGLGGGVSFPVGRGKVSEIVGTEMSVQIRDRSTGTVIWEGRATTEGEDRDPQESATRLASALFRGFPGESGRTITVR